MDRNIVYPGQIPLDTDILMMQRSVMAAFGYFMQMVVGTGTIVDGLTVGPTGPASLSVLVAPGSITSAAPVDNSAFGSLASDTSDTIMKMGINSAQTTFTMTAPGVSGQSINYLIEAALLESDASSAVLPYYNSGNPSSPFSGPANSGAAQYTQRLQRVGLQMKAGASATTGSQTTPATDAGYVGLAVVTVAHGQTTITSGNIMTLATAPYITNKLPTLSPGFGAGVHTVSATGTTNFTLPNGITQIEVELWGAGSGSWGSTSTKSAGGGSGGGYARKRITGITPGSTCVVVIGAQGVGGTAGSTAPTSGGSSTFTIGATTYLTCTGGTANPAGSVSDPTAGNLGGTGSGGDVNLTGGDGGNGVYASGNYGGVGGDGPMSGGCVNAGTVGRSGYFPGGGASGAGNQSGVAYNGANGADGLCVIRW